MPRLPITQMGNEMQRNNKRVESKDKQGINTLQHNVNMGEKMYRIKELRPKNNSISFDLIGTYGNTVSKKENTKQTIITPPIVALLNVEGQKKKIAKTTSDHHDLRNMVRKESEL